MSVPFQPRAAQILKHDKQHGEDLLSAEITSGDRIEFYVGVAPEGSSTSAAVWEIVRRVEDVDSNGRTVTIFDSRTGMKWDNFLDPTLDGKAAWRSDWW